MDMSFWFRLQEAMKLYMILDGLGAGRVITCLSIHSSATQTVLTHNLSSSHAHFPLGFQGTPQIWRTNCMGPAKIHNCALWPENNLPEAGPSQ